MLRPVTVLSVAAAVLALSAACFAAELLVPSEYPTIQAAIDAAVAGDTVIIAPGTYTGDGNRDIDFKGKAITVRSIDPNDQNIVEATVIDCEQQGRGFYLNGCAGATISGLTITNGLAEAGAGIYCKDSKFTISNCQIAGNRAKDGEKAVTEKADDGGDGGGIYCTASHLTVRNCNLSGNAAGDGGDGCDDHTVAEWGADAGSGGSGGGIYARSSSLTIERTVLAGNEAGNGGNGFFANAAGVGGRGGGIHCSDSTVVIQDCRIAENEAGNGGDKFHHGNGSDGGGGAGLCCIESSVVMVAASQIIENSTGTCGWGDPINGRPGRSGYGAGVYCDGTSSLQVSDCNVVGNVLAYGFEGSGGGIYCISEAGLQVTDSYVTNNKAAKGGSHMVGSNKCVHGGGGIFCVSAKIENSTIGDNSTGDGKGEAGAGLVEARPGGSGGGILCVGSLELINCNINSNSTGTGGGGDYSSRHGGDGGGVWAQTLTATGCKFANNRTGEGGRGGNHVSSGDGGAGGGIYCVEANLIDCEIIKNRTGDTGRYYERAGRGGSGGGIYCSSGKLKDCIISGNRTGDGIYEGERTGYVGCGGQGGGAYCDSATVMNCLIVGNVTGDTGSYASSGREGANGAGIRAKAATIASCTIAANSVGRNDFRPAPVNVGGGVFGGSETVFIDSIVWGNSPDGLFGVDCNNVSFCDISDDICDGGLGNMSLDPLFVRNGYWADANDPNITVEPNDPNALWMFGDYRLSHVVTGQQLDSPCIDAGSDLSANLELDELTTRIDGVADGGIVDMGFHYAGPTLADADGDRNVDWADYAFLAENWLSDVNWSEYKRVLGQYWRGVGLPRIREGSIVVDGDGGDWPALGSGEWVRLNKVYYGDPVDVSLDARYALRWDPASSKLYMAAGVYDTDHVFSDEYVRWDASDRIEIYVQAVPEGGTNWARVYDVAQQYMIGPNTTGGHWATWAYGEQVAEDVGLESVVWISGSYIFYEMGIPLFDYYGGISGGETVSSVLEPGRVIGFDIIVSSRDSSDGFGMLSDNMMTGKSQDAGQFAKRVLSSPMLYLPEGGYEVDLNYDGVVNWHDLVLLANSWLWPEE